MDLKALDLTRWEDGASPPLVAAPLVAPVARGMAPAPDAARFRFLTADGQAATPLEQEALLGTNDMVEASFLDRCQLVTGCVGRVRFSTPRGRSYATGFMIAPGLMMTNHHVFPDAVAARGASIEFGYRYDIAGQLAPTSEFDLAPQEFHVASEELDFAVVAVSPLSTTGAPLEERSYLRLNPASGKAEENDFVTIIQHPEGDSLRIALRENRVTRAHRDEAVIWYAADTAHGSSGAPVFNDSFQLAALHASGRIKRNERGEYALRNGTWRASLDGLRESDVIWEANVGMRVSQICAKLIELAEARSPRHGRILGEAMQGGDVLANAVARLKVRATEGELKEGGTDMRLRPSGLFLTEESSGIPSMGIACESGACAPGSPSPSRRWTAAVWRL